MKKRRLYLAILGLVSLLMMPVFSGCDGSIDVETPVYGVFEGKASIGPRLPEEIGKPYPAQVYQPRKVMVYDADHVELLRQVDLDENGYFSVELPPGDYTFDINYFGTDTSDAVPRKLKIDPGMHVMLDIDFDTGVPIQGTSPSPTWVPPTPVITQEEAIAIAYRNVPSLVVERAPLSVRWTPQIAPHGAWQMEFEDPGITQEELGWVNNPSGTPEVRLNDIVSTEIYKILLINIDGQTGVVTLKMASSADIRTYTLPPPLTVVPPKAPTTPPETTSAITKYMEEFQEPPYLRRLFGEDEKKLTEIVTSDARIQELIKDKSYDFEVDGIRVQGSDWHLATGVLLKEGLTSEQKSDFQQQSLQGQINRDAVESFRGQLSIGSGGGGVIFPFFLDMYDIVIDFDRGQVESVSQLWKAQVPQLTLSERKQAVETALNDARLQEILKDKAYRFAPTGVYVVPDKDLNKVGAAFEIWLDNTYSIDVTGTDQPSEGSVLAVCVTFTDNKVSLRLQGGPS